MSINCLSSSFFISLLFFCSVNALGQINQVSRLEVPIDQELIDNDRPGVISLDSAGIISFRRFSKSPQDQLEITRLDTALQIQWKRYIPVSDTLLLVASKASSQSLFFLFSIGRGTIGDFVILTVRISDGKHSFLPISNLIIFYYFQMEVTQQVIWIGGYFNNRPLVLRVDLQTQKTKILPGFFNEIGQIAQLKSKQDGTLEVVLVTKSKDRGRCLSLKNYDMEGRLLTTTIIDPVRKRNLNFGRSVQTDDGRTIVAGIYGKSVEFSNGIFVSVINKGGGYQTQYYNFSDLKNFFSFKKEKREQRIINRIERKKSNGKSINFNYRLLVQELVQFDNQLLLLAEAFYPHYSYRSRAFGARIFDGFQYTHAVVIGLDLEGKLQWDNSFEINDVRSMLSEQYTKMGKGKSQFVLTYSIENSVRSKVIDQSDVIKSKTSTSMKPNNPNDFVKAKETYLSKLDYWYEGHFFVYGFQTVRSTDNESSSRKVFFINKLRFN